MEDQIVSSPTKWISCVDAAARHPGLTRSYFRSVAIRGLVESLHLGGKIMLDLADLDRFIEERRIRRHTSLPEVTA